ncbi:UNKNOWN [Stylonychia lemnae]|uniref:Cyclic nucleotide-binding domain-containing protein n=1 Tax=Stylonychia lemnae TaxID=5949 RepID=A0A078AHA3_STYLE|nr:UNKNOWN [Stylonychia lemnae]|eukprot:CDW81634.1 UNKNOWN [Stylonychia lemnae]
MTSEYDDLPHKNGGLKNKLSKGGKGMSSQKNISNNDLDFERNAAQNYDNHSQPKRGQSQSTATQERQRKNMSQQKKKESMSKSEWAIRLALISNIKQQHEYFINIPLRDVDNLDIKDLMEQSKKIVQNQNQEQESNQQKLFNNLGKQSTEVKEREKLQLNGSQNTRYSDPYRIKWDIFVIYLAFWNCFVIPVDIAFITEETIFLTVIDQIINAIFLIDIIIIFRTTYYNKRGEEVFDQKAIALEYIKSGRFFFDFLACVPFDRFIYTQGDALKAFGVFKLIRISRLSQILQKVDLRDDKKALIQVLQLLLYLLMYVHCTTCLWWYIVTFDNSWVPPKDIYLGKTDLYEKPVSFQYFMCMYYAIMIVGSNELFPATTFQKFYLAIMMLVGNLIIANIIGEMAVLMQVITRRSSAFHEKLDIANTIMYNINITSHTQDKIRDFFFTTRTTLEQQKELNTFLELISPSLRQQVSQHIFYEILLKNEMLSSLFQKHKYKDEPVGEGGDHQIEKTVSINKDIKLANENKFNSPLMFIIQNLEIQLNRPEDVIIQQENTDTDMYFLARGEAKVIMKDKQGKEFHIRDLKEGSHFGEIAMIYKTKRTASVISLNYSTFAILTEAKYKELTQYIPELQGAIKSYINRYKDPIKKNIVKMISRIEFINKEFPQNLLTQLLYTTPSRQYDKGQLIFKPGDNMNTIQLIEVGIVEIYNYFEGKKFVLERLFKGSVINYRNLFLDDEPMQVYAECLTLCYILEIEEDNLVSIVNQDQKTQKRLLTYQNELLKTNLVYALDYVVIIPASIMDKHYKPKNLSLESFRRMTRMKNVVMRRIIEIREQKAKPKLQDLLSHYLGKDKNQDPSLTDEQRKQIRADNILKLKKKLLDLYDDQKEKGLSEIETIQKAMKNIKRKSDAQWQIIESLDTSMNVLKQIREEKDRKNLQLEEEILKVQS